MDASDKRHADRAAITLRVDYKRLNTFFADYTKNISKGGTFIKTIKPLEVGTEFVFVLSVPAEETQLKLRGKVIWVTTEEQAKANQAASGGAPPSQSAGGGAPKLDTDRRTPGMGIRFLYADDAERNAIDDIVEKLMSSALGEHLSTKLLARKPAEE
jgi:type IV pilus assembly protein PilZ